MSDPQPRIILVTGGTGQVGSYLAETLASHGRVIAPSRTELDLSAPDSIQRVVRAAKPDWIVHPAAYTAVDKAEADAATCFAVNAEATAVLAEEAARLGAPLVTFSTDYVFNGEESRPYREDDPTGPRNVYGASKLAAEQALAASKAVYLNLRTSWVYSARGHNFVKTMLRFGAERPELRVVNDQYGCPTSALDLANAVAKLMIQPMQRLQAAAGTYHLAGTGATTWFDFAEHLLARGRSLRPDKAWATMQAVPSTEFPTPAKRPANSRLDCTQIRETFGIEMPRWQDSADRVVAELLA